MGGKSRFLGVKLYKNRNGGIDMKWSEERAWEWYNSRPWIRGCNYMSADCANRVDLWQSYGFEERFKTTEEELKVMQALGYNSVRLILEFVVWDEEHDSFMERFERYVSLCDKYGISCMIVLANDCMRPKGMEKNTLGEQHYDWGYHGGRKQSQHDSLGIGDHVLDYPETAERYFAMVREIVDKYKNNERIVMWDVYNEVGNSGREPITLPNLQKLFELLREIDPIQPLTCEVWRFGPQKSLDDVSEVEKYALEQSDIISFHSYLPYRDLIKQIKMLKVFNRPIVCSEWLNRIAGNTVFDTFPLFYLEKIGCYNWGFVAGKYQTYEPWNFYWLLYDQNPNIDFDFTKWFHDLYRPNHRPYDPKEEKLIREFCKLADEDFVKEKKE